MERSTRSWRRDLENSDFSAEKSLREKWLGLTSDEAETALHLGLVEIGVFDD